MIELLLTDYHNFDKRIMNHYNIIKEEKWDDLLDVISKTTDLVESNINLHIYNGIVLPRNVLLKLNDYNVTVTIAFYDFVDRDFLLKYYIKYAIVERLVCELTITGNVDKQRLAALEHSLRLAYKTFHVYDVAIHFNIQKTVSDDIIQYFSEMITMYDDNRANAIPYSLYAYMLINFIKEYDVRPYIPYGMFVLDKGKITVNKNMFQIDEIEFESTPEKVTEEELDKIRTSIYNTVVSTYKCSECSGAKICPKLKTIFNDVKPDTCASEYKHIWDILGVTVSNFSNFRKTIYNTNSSNPTQY